MLARKPTLAWDLRNDQIVSISVRYTVPFTGSDLTTIKDVAIQDYTKYQFPRLFSTIDTIDRPLYFQASKGCFEPPISDC